MVMSFSIFWDFSVLQSSGLLKRRFLIFILWNLLRQLKLFRFWVREWKLSPFSWTMKRFIFRDLRSFGVSRSFRSCWVWVFIFRQRGVSLKNRGYRYFFQERVLLMDFWARYSLQRVSFCCSKNLSFIIIINIYIILF